MTINCNGQLIDLTLPKVMGILNITPDSFYDGGTLKSDASILKRTAQMLTEGATFIDVGGYSSKPGAKDVSVEEELSRVLPAVRMITREFPKAFVSVDTFRSEVAKACVAEGAHLVNDISAGKLDAQMLSTVAQLKVPYIAMHMQGTPQTMQQNPSYQDVVFEIRKELSLLLEETKALQIKDVIVDVGFGFGKTIEHNYQLLKHLELFKALDAPILVGLSRKSMIYKVLNSSAQEALNGTTALHSIALTKGAHILRVHDVKEAIECVQLIDMLNN